MIMESQGPTPSEPLETSKIGFFKKHKILSIILISVASLIVIMVAAAFFMITVVFVTVRDGCTERDNRLQASVSSLESRLKTISINGSSPNEVKVWKDGDCLTGKGAVGTASFFKFPYSHTTEANREVAKSLNAIASQDNNSFIFGDDNGDGFVEFIQTRLFNSVDNEAYKAKYYLIDKISCPDHEDDSNICIRGEPSEDIQIYMSKPINKIELQLSMTAN